MEVSILCETVDGKVVANMLKGIMGCLYFQVTPYDSDQACTDEVI